MNLPPVETLAQLGKTMREIDPSALQHDDEEGPVRWFLGDSGTELFAWGGSDSAPAKHLQLIVARMQVEWTERTGLTAAPFRQAGTSMGGRYDTYLLGRDRALDRQLIEGARALLDSANIPAPLVAPMRSALEQALLQLMD
jgi:hypothetical protein